MFVTLLVTSGRGPVTQASASSWRFALALAVGLLVTAGAFRGELLGVHPPVRRPRVDGRLGGGERGDRVRDRGAPPRALHPAGVCLPRPDPVHRLGNDGIVTVGGATFQARSLFVIVLGVVLAGGLSLLISRTRFGRGLQAISQDADGARIVGVPLDRYVNRAFALVGAIAVVIAVAAAPSGPFSVSSGALLGVKGLVAALVVGFSDPIRRVRRRARPRRRRGGDRERRDLGALDRPRVPRGAAARVRAPAPRRCGHGRRCPTRNERARADAVALREGARDARRAWGSLQWAAVALVAAFAVLPWLGLGFVRVDELAAWFYLALAATGLALCVGLAGLPSLGQGAFMSIGAFATAVLAARAGWPPMAALPAALGRLAPRRRDHRPGRRPAAGALRRGQHLAPHLARRTRRRRVSVALGRLAGLRRLLAARAEGRTTSSRSG